MSNEPTCTFKCEWCSKQHANEFSRTCADCDRERESGDLDECPECEQFYEPPGNPDGCDSCGVTFPTEAERRDEERNEGGAE